MENCNQTLTMQLQCSCHDINQSPVQRQEEGMNLRPLYQKFAHTLQSELQKLSEGYITQIDTLNAEIFGLKNTMQRLEIRNKKDADAQKELRRQYNILQQKLKEKGTVRSSPQVQIVERVKEVRVDVTDPSLPLEVTRWKQKYEETLQLHLKAKAEKEATETAKKDLLEQIQRLHSTISNLKRQLDESKRKDGGKQQQIQKLQSHIEFLKANKQVVVETRHFFPDFKPVERVRPETRIETVYVQKPVEKVVIMQVERRVKEFIQPERPLVNRIISCEPREDCRCKEEDFRSSRSSAETEHLNEVVSRLEGNIQEYKNEREKLVHVIEDKNRELNSLETHLRLLGRGDNYHRGASTVNVTVTKLDEERPISQKMTRVVEQEQTRATQVRRR